MLLLTDFSDNAKKVFISLFTAIRTIFKVTFCNVSKNLLYLSRKIGMNFFSSVYFLIYSGECHASSWPNRRCVGFISRSNDFLQGQHYKSLSAFKGLSQRSVKKMKTNFNLFFIYRYMALTLKFCIRISWIVLLWCFEIHLKMTNVSTIYHDYIYSNL